MERLNEIWLVFEITPDFVFHHMYEDEQKAKEHVILRQKHIVGTEMEGRTIYCRKYVVLE